MLSLDQIGANPTLATEMPHDEVCRLYQLASAAQAALLVELVRGSMPLTMSPASRTLSVDQVADRLGRSPAFVRDLLRRGALPGRRLGKKYWGVLESELVAWQAAGRAIDTISSPTLPSGCDANRVTAPAQTARPHTVAIRGARRGPSGHGEKMGNGNARHETDD